MAVVVALAAAMGALLERGPSPWIGALLVVAALASRRPAALAMAVFVLAGGLAARAEAGLVPVLPGSFTGSATLLTDPELIAGGLRADVRLGDGRHMQAVARAPAAVEQFRDRAAGQQLVVRGRLGRPPPGSDSSLRQRHIVGQLVVDEVTGWSEGTWPARAANAVRTALQRGASALPERQRALFLGFVLGDTRGQPADITDDFRASGL